MKKMRSKLLIVLLLFSFFCKSLGQTTDTFKDERDNKVYKISKIGEQWWFAENLAFKPQTGDYCAYNNEQNNVQKFGYLYSWETAKNVCPKGWHLPDNSDWGNLINFLGGGDSAGLKVKTYDTTLWRNINNKCIDLYNFSALPAGRTIQGKFNDFGKSAYFWSKDEKDVNIAFTFYVQGGRKFKSDEYHKGYGLSIRCVRNKTTNTTEISYNPNDINSFWNNFQNAVNQNQKDTILAMSLFPLKYDILNSSDLFSKYSELFDEDAIAMITNGKPLQKVQLQKKADGNGIIYNDDAVITFEVVTNQTNLNDFRTKFRLAANAKIYELNFSYSYEISGSSHPEQSISISFIFCETSNGIKFCGKQ